MKNLLSTYWWSLILAFLVTVIVIKLMLPFAQHLKLIDHPNGRKYHLSPTPVIGGIAMFVALSFSSLCLPTSLQPFRAFFAAALLLIFIGIIDDCYELTPYFRLFMQIVVGLMMVMWGHVVLNDLGTLMFNIHLNYSMSLIISVCAMIGIINAINMLDGIDGLVGTMTLLQFLCLIYLAFIKGYLINITIIVFFVPVLLGFLYFNFPWRKQVLVFMGDAGSMFLGFALVWFCIYLSQAPHRAARPVVFLWIMAIPLLDIGATIIHRLLCGHSPFKPDRKHIHHLLFKLGFNNLAIVLLLGGATLVFAIMGILAEYLQINSMIVLLAFILLFVSYLLLTQYMWRRH